MMSLHDFNNRLENTSFGIFVSGLAGSLGPGAQRNVLRVSLAVPTSEPFPKTNGMMGRATDVGDGRVQFSLDRSGASYKEAFSVRRFVLGRSAL